jgi:hypothetical protein
LEVSDFLDRHLESICGTCVIVAEEGKNSHPRRVVGALDHGMLVKPFGSPSKRL